MPLPPRTLALLPDDSFLIVPDTRLEQFFNGTARAPAVCDNFVFYLDVFVSGVAGLRKINGVLGYRYPVTKQGLLDYATVTEGLIAVLDNPATPATHRWLPSGYQLRRVFDLLGIGAPPGLPLSPRPTRTAIPPGARPHALPPTLAPPRQATARGT